MARLARVVVVVLLLLLVIALSEYQFGSLSKGAPFQWLHKPSSLKEEQRRLKDRKRLSWDDRVDLRPLDFEIENTTHMFHPALGQQYLNRDRYWFPVHDSGSFVPIKETERNFTLKPCKRVISMALYGDLPKYIFGGLENALLTRRDWKGWTLRIYHDHSVPVDIRKDLKDLGAELVAVSSNTNTEDHRGMFWRYYVTNDPDVCRFIVRDIDSRLTYRDKVVVDEWIKTGELFHTIRDHLSHGVPILGGMWGSVGGLIDPSLMESYKQRQRKTRFNDDQQFLEKFVWPNVRDYTVAYDSWHCNNPKFACKVRLPIPIRMAHDNDFIGNPYDPENHYQGDPTESRNCPCPFDQTWTTC